MNMNAGKTIALRYVAIILKEPGEGYCSTVPDLGACFVHGRAIAEAKADLPDALELHIDGMRAEMTAMPPARHRDEILTTLDHDIVEDYVVEIDVEPSLRTSQRMLPPLAMACTSSARNGVRKDIRDEGFSR